MTWSLTTLTDVLDRVQDIFSTIWGPIVLATLGFSLLALFLHSWK